MADKKISQLTGATTPLAGTEELPIVQSGATVKVSVNNLTAGKTVSANVLEVAAGTVGAPSITTAGDTNTGIYFPAADTIGFAEGGVEAGRFDSSGNFGIGTGGTINVSGQEISRATGSATPTPVELRLSTTTSASNWSTTSPWGQISFYSFDPSDGGAKVMNSIRAVADATSGGVGRLEIWGDNAGTPEKMMQIRRNSSISFYTSTVEQLTIDSNVNVKAGNLVIGTSGKGIDFSATPGTGTSELLADYEEGTWTPVYKPDSGAFASVTYDIQQGQYVKVGNVVTITASIRTDAVSLGTASSVLLIIGLPFTGSSTPYGGVAIGYTANFNTTAPNQIVIYPTELVVYLTATSSNGYAATNLKNAANANHLIFSATYIAA
jgi:hypothetical protein